MKSIREQDTRVLILLSTHPEGLFLRQIHAQLAGFSKPNTSQRLRKLTKKGYIRKAERLYYITKEGIDTLSILNDTKKTAALGHKKSLISPIAKVQSQAKPATTPPDESEDKKGDAYAKVEDARDMEAQRHDGEVAHAALRDCNAYECDDKDLGLVQGHLVDFILYATG